MSSVGPTTATAVAADRRLAVVSGAPGTGKSTVASRLADSLDLPLLSLDRIKESLADVLGTGDESWSNSLGDAAAEVIFRFGASFPACVVEGWWRRERKTRATKEFVGCVEVFCRCDPQLAEERMRARHGALRHPIHRDVINPDLLAQTAELVRTVVPLGIGRSLIEVDTTDAVDWDGLVEAVNRALKQPFDRVRAVRPR
jgi:gluconate kinase